MNSVYILQDTSYYNVLINSIINAKESIYISMFSFNMHERMDNDLLVRDLVKLICKKQMEGLDIRIIFGNSYKISENSFFKMLDMSNELTYTVLKSYGVKVSFFKHYQQESSHSKYVIIDDKIVFVGSHNFSPRSFGVGYDDSISILDNRLASHLKNIFLTDWKYSFQPSNSNISDFDPNTLVFPNFEKKQYDIKIVEDNDMYFDVLLNEEYFNSIIEEMKTAQKTIDISMFYFSYSDEKNNITSQLFDSINIAKKNGLKIRIILDRDNPSDIYASYKTNKKRYDQLKEIGIDAKFDAKETATHSKFVIVDNKKLFIGSHNWTYGSFTKYQDLSLLVNSPSLCNNFTEIFQKRFVSLQ